MPKKKKRIYPLRKFEKRVIKAARLLKNFQNNIYVVAGAKWEHFTSIRANASYSTTEKLQKEFDPRLQDALAPLGSLGTKPKGRPNYIGNCAEQQACNDVLMKDRVNKVKVKQVKFTLAYRPRTCEIIPYCSNCTNTFNINN